MKLLFAILLSYIITSLSFADDLDCVCGSVYAVGDQVVTIVDDPLGSTNLPAGSLGTVICGTTALKFLVIEFANWNEGFSGDASCTCGDELGPKNNHWYVFCDDIILDGIITVCSSGCQYTSINDAIDAASNGDIIQLSAETYTSKALINTDGKSITISGTTDIDGNATSIIDSMVFCEDNEDSSTVLENLVFLDTMVNNGSTPTVLNCIFKDINGSGMHNYNSSPTVTDCTFNHNVNSSNNGGGMHNIDSSPVLTNCIFIDNGATRGGGIYNDTQQPSIASSPILTNCTFFGNFATNGGGIYSEAYCSLTLENCVFTENSGYAGGGGLWNYFYSYGDYISNTIIINCTFTENESLFGAGMLLNGIGENSTGPILINTTVCGNLCPWPNEDCGTSQIEGDGLWFDKGGNTVADECECIGDLDLDGEVKASDLLILIGEWGICSDCVSDLDGDGEVKVADLLLLIGAWGVCP